MVEAWEAQLTVVPYSVLSAVADRGLEGSRVGTVHGMVVAAAFCNHGNVSV